jgi:hypothetical protein
MATIEDLKTRVQTARAAVDAAEKSGDAAAEIVAVDDLDAAETALLDAQKADRKFRGKRAERQAKAAAAGKYQVGIYDIGTALSQLNPDEMPGGGVVVFRSAALDVRKTHEAVVADPASDAEAQARATITMICSCTVAPVLADSAAGIAYRAWWEGPGRGMVNQAALEIGRLGGFQYAAFQRATK